MNFLSGLADVIAFIKRWVLVKVNFLADSRHWSRLVCPLLKGGLNSCDLTASDSETPR